MTFGAFRRIFALVAASSLALIGIAFSVSSAQAGTTTGVTTSATGIARGSVLPGFSVTVADSSGSLSGATFQVLDTWELNPALKATAAVMTPGIDSISDGNNVDVPLADLKCTYRPGGSSSWSASISFGPADANAGTTYASPLTVHFSAGVFTAPSFATPTTQWRVLARNDDEGVTGSPIVLTFNVIDAVTTPDEQSISCVAGEPIESKPLVTTGMNGTVTYSVTDDPPAGVAIDPVTGVISGTPAFNPGKVKWHIAVTSSRGQIGSAQVYVNQPLPDTGLDVNTPAVIGFGLLLAGLALVLMRRVARR